MVLFAMGKINYYEMNCPIFKVYRKFSITRQVTVD